jgi:hypothetical protein
VEGDGGKAAFKIEQQRNEVTKPSLWTLKFESGRLQPVDRGVLMKAKNQDARQDPAFVSLFLCCSMPLSGEGNDRKNLQLSSGVGVFFRVGYHRTEA